MHTYRNHSGFTLIELSIVLVIIGMLIGLGSNMLGTLTTYAKVRETRDSMDANIQSVISWASSHNRLPQLGEFRVAAAKNQNDAWGRPYAFIYDANLAPAAATKDTICGRRSTFLNISTIDPTATVRNVAYAVVSHADNYDFNSRLNGVLLTADSAAASGAASTITATGPNSDMIRWVTLDELRSKIGCQGAQLKIVNNELPYGAAPIDYSVTLVADGGVPFAANPSTFKWCVNTLPAGFAQSGGVQSADCYGLSEEAWAPASSGLILSFPSGIVATGAYPITAVVRDNADTVATSAACSSTDPGDNCAQKLYVVTVNP
ncbi:MAG: prepilin-type N-terminal cleavage/methylation domain-containing protein [Desulfuromonadaceae bacterium]|nr:prepilin-type N-terminal cleavage/methylation domain-containing protein [Desulfuromonadaceae bacterium]MDD5104073.1 prepilin-type N-terminal cleavage/methylation domain-containing protein [Desulfuromonadaceae bacterium]